MYSNRHSTYLGDAVTFNGGTDLLRSRGDVESGFGFQSVLQGFASDTGTTAHVFIAGIRAAAN